MCPCNEVDNWTVKEMKMIERSGSVKKRRRCKTKYVSERPCTQTLQAVFAKRNLLPKVEKIYRNKDNGKILED